METSEIIGKDMLDSLVGKIIEFNDNAEKKLENVINDYNNYFQTQLESIKKEAKKIGKEIDGETENEIIQRNETFIENATKYFTENKKQIIYNSVKETLDDAIETIILNNIDSLYPRNKNYYEKKMGYVINSSFVNYLISYFGGIFINSNKKIPAEPDKINKTLGSILSNFQRSRGISLNYNIENTIDDANIKIAAFGLTYDESIDIKKQKDEILKYLGGNEDLKGKWGQKWKPFKDYLKQIEKKIAPEKKTGSQSIYT